MAPRFENVAFTRDVSSTICRSVVSPVSTAGCGPVGTGGAGGAPTGAGAAAGVGGGGGRRGRCGRHGRLAVRLDDERLIGEEHHEGEDDGEKDATFHAVYDAWLNGRDRNRPGPTGDTGRCASAPSTRPARRRTARGTRSRRRNTTVKTGMRRRTTARAEVDRCERATAARGW